MLFATQRWKRENDKINKCKRIGSKDDDDDDGFFIPFPLKLLLHSFVVCSPLFPNSLCGRDHCQQPAKKAPFNHPNSSLAPLPPKQQRFLASTATKKRAESKEKEKHRSRWALQMHAFFHQTCFNEEEAKRQEKKSLVAGDDVSPLSQLLLCLFFVFVF